jgi:hydroxymethylpyrimidine pyrophosphatase-like HAD family hydrolase/energy-coupling factor transporter ATP-binding protein EcfA2
MRYLVLVTDYDGTLAVDGKADESTLSALERLRMSGRRAILLTGRQLDDLLTVCPKLSVFDYVVAENGAVLYEPRTRQQTLLGKPPPARFLRRLRELTGNSIGVGKVIVDTRVPHHTAVLQAIQEMGLELQIVFNDDSVMVLPTGVNKASGMDHALRKLGLSPHEAIGIGNAQNDHSFLESCECAVAVANALPAIRELAAFTTAGAAGQGVVEVIDELIANDFSRMHGRLEKHLVAIGIGPDGTAVTIPPYGLNILIAGPSGSGKSTLTAGIIERLIDRAYQVCIVDPEGDYGTLPQVLTLGSPRHAIPVNEALAVLEDPKLNLNLNLLGIPLADRPQYFGHLFPSLQAMRTRTGRPHWIVLDEAHHMLPLHWGHVGQALPHQLGETVLVTVHPEHVAPLTLSLVDVVVLVGESPEKTLKAFADALGLAFHWPDGLSYRRGHAVAWFPRNGKPPFSMRLTSSRVERIRHLRKYAEGNLRDRSFYFRGPEGRLNLKAQNLVIFAQIAEGIDEETWLFHLHNGDYSTWFREAVKDSYLADQTERIEHRPDLQPAETRGLIVSFIEGRYTLPE